MVRRRGGEKERDFAYEENMPHIKTFTEDVM